jgi:hypothetical protein
MFFKNDMSDEPGDEPKLLSPDQPAEIPVFYDGREVGTVIIMANMVLIRMHEPESRRFFQSSFRQLLINESGIAYAIQISPGANSGSE